MQRLLAIDVGPQQSAYCELHDGAIGQHGWLDNDVLLSRIRGNAEPSYVTIIESPQAQDRPLGKMLRDTIWWAARFAEAIDSRGVEWHEAEERDVAFWLTGNRSANNPAILQSLKDVFGDKTQQPCDRCNSTGTVMGIKKPKKCPRCNGKNTVTIPSPLSALNEHERSALAAAHWYYMKQQSRKAAS